jgi:hypothetical protein
MPDVRPARDAARAACDRKHDLANILDDTLIILAVEVSKPVPSESAAWLARAQKQLTDAIDACDAVRDAIAVAQAEVTRLARQVPVARDSPLRCPKPMVHPDESVERCVLHVDHMQDDIDHVDPHGHRAPVEIRQSTIEQARMIREEFYGG